MRGRLLALGLLSCLLLTTLMPLAEAQTPPGTVAPPPRSVWTVFNTVETTIEDHYAIVRVIADIGNRGPDPEFPFQVRVPDDAFVTGLTIIRDGVAYNATIARRDAARQSYETTKAAQLTGGLVEQQRGSSVYAFLVNVAEFESVRAILTWERYLAADRGTYNLSLEAPVSGFGQDLGARFDVRVRHAEGVAGLWGDAGQAVREGDGWRLRHSVGPRQGDAPTPLMASYTLGAPREGGSLLALVQGGEGSFAHRVRPALDAPRLPLDLVLVLDVSGSMNAERKVDQMKDAAGQLLQQLRAEDRLHLVFFSSGTRAPWSGLVAVDLDLRAKAASEIRDLLAAGGTNIHAGIRDGLGAFDGLPTSEDGRQRMLVFLTDGVPTEGGIRDRAALRDLARRENDRGASVFALAFGSDADWGLVAGLAADGQGVALRVPQGSGAEVDLRRFLDALASPVLKDVRVFYDGNVTAWRRTAPILFQGSELLVVGNFDPRLERLTGNITALGPSGAVRIPFAGSVQAGHGTSFLPRLVAYQRIRHLQDQLAADGPLAALTEEVVRLALKHGFVTEHTSLVVGLEARRGVQGLTGSAAGGISPASPSAPSMTGLATATQGGWSSSNTSGAPAADAAIAQRAQMDAQQAAVAQQLAQARTQQSQLDQQVQQLTTQLQEQAALQSELQSKLDEERVESEALRAKAAQQDARATPGLGGLVVLGALALLALAARRR